MNSPLTKRASSHGRSSTADSQKSEIDYATNPDAYFSKLEQFYDHAETVRKQESDQEKALMEFLPVNEKFNLNKEGKVIARWQQRQRDWERIQDQIKRRLTSKVQKPLMMTTTDEFRARMEEYDMLQAAVPLKDRFSDSSWQVMLRGGGPIRFAIGHIFSGIECEIDLEIPKPKMIRKPKPSETIGKNDTFVDQTSTYLAIRKKYHESIREIRPREMTYRDASDLVVRSKSLFKWAKESSAAYFQARREEDMDFTAAAGEMEVLPPQQGLQDGSAIIEGTSASFVGETFGSKIDFLSPKEIIFHSTKTKNCMMKVSFKNTGTTAVQYHWKRVTNSKGGHHEDGVEKLFDILNEKGIDNGLLRTRTLDMNRECFFCVRETGEILPDETVSSSFMFSSCADGGSFSSDWILQLSPEETGVYLQTGTGAAAGNGSGSGGKANPEGGAGGGHVMAHTPPSSVGSVVLKMRGHCVTHDESVHKRSDLSQVLSTGAEQAMARDVVYDCLRKVRDPVRMKDLQARQVELFRLLNTTLLTALSEKYAAMLPTFITPERLDIFCALYTAASDVLVAVKTTLQTERTRFLAWATQEDATAMVEGGQLPDRDVDLSNPLIMSSELVTELRSAVFPEQFIEIFDEVTEEQLLPSWNYNVSAILDALNAALLQAEELARLEESNSKHDAAEEKLRLKAERRAAKLAAMDSDDDEDDDEDEEEPEEEEEDAPAKPKHPFVIATQDLINELHSTLNLLVTHPLPEQTLMEIASEFLGQLADSIVEKREVALEAAELTAMVHEHSVPIPPLPSAFNSEEGVAIWAHALEQTSPHAEPEGGKKGGKPAKNAPPPTEATPQQVHYFYKVFYDEVRAAMLDSCAEMFAAVDQALQRDSMAPFVAYQASRETLFEIATLRSSDLLSSGSAIGAEQAEAITTNADTAELENKVAFVNFNGDAFTLQESVLSAFDVNKSNKLKAVEPIMKLIEWQAKAIVILYESSSASPDVSILGYSEELKTLITQKREEYISQHNKALKKLKQKPPVYKNLEFSQYGSFGDFYYHTENFFRHHDATADTGGKYFQETIPIFFVDNVRGAGVVPQEPDYVEVDSDDEEAPICIGVEESVVKRRQQWEAQRPHRVEVPLDCTASGVPKRPSSGHSWYDAQPPPKTIPCFADASACITEAVSTVTRGTSVGTVWVEACVGKLFDMANSFQKLGVAELGAKYVSTEIREMCLWTGVLQLMPRAVSILESASSLMQAEEVPPEAAQPEQAVGEAEETVEGGARESAENPTTTTAPAPTTDSQIAKRFTELFPYSLVAGTTPRTVVVVGGSIRADKFTFIDQLIDLVEDIYIVGELALAFVCLSQRYKLTQYTLQCAPYRAVCTTLLAKARMRGVHLHWPIDFIFGDEPINADDKMKCFLHVEPDARNEGFEYEGEGKPVQVSDAQLDFDTGAVEEIIVPGYAYDIGPETCNALKSALESADFVWIWGTAGLVEASSFQAGQQCLIDHATMKPGAEDVAGAGAAAGAAVDLTANPQITVLMGDSTVEWFTRMIDSDGEWNGDLVAAGAVTFAARDSSVMNGLMGLYALPTAQKTLTLRAPDMNEFVYSKRVFDEEEEEDEDEDEEEDD